MVWFCIQVIRRGLYADFSNSTFHARNVIAIKEVLKKNSDPMTTINVFNKRRSVTTQIISAEQHIAVELDCLSNCHTSFSLLAVNEYKLRGNS